MAMPANLRIDMEGHRLMTPSLLRQALANLGHGWGSPSELRDRLHVLDWATLQMFVPLEYTMTVAQIVAAFQNVDGDDWTAD